MRVLLTAFVIAAAALPAAAQNFGAAENLGPAIPTPQYLVDRMLEAGRVKPGEMVYDLGSGDDYPAIAASQVVNHLAGFDTAGLQHSVHQVLRCGDGGPQIFR